MADRNDNVHEADESLPDELAGRLEQLYRPLVFVPPEVDERIMDEAGRRLAPVRRRQWRGRVASAWGSMAAVLLAAVTLWWFGEFLRDPIRCERPAIDTGTLAPTRQKMVDLSQSGLVLPG